MKDVYTDIIEMHKKFGISNIESDPARLSAEEKEFRVKALTEELAEFITAETLEDDIDAIIDLVVFALGTLERMGVDFYAHWNIVMAANMAKEICGEAKKSKRGFAFDLCKPKGWQPPNHALLLAKK
jgi:predicted HAD superfamily Cof-like phosphohydrolase